MKKLILKCALSPGDIVMLTAAVRDLHRGYPRQFQTDVRTSCPDLWDNNPYITPLAEEDPEVQTIDCHYPLIDRCDQAPYHCLHGFIEFLNHRLGLAIKPTLFKGDIHLSAQEKAWHSQVREVTREDIPFWIVAAGGKYDITIKWWQSQRYQEVLNHFRGRIQFVQVGQTGHHHPRLDGVIDLRGRTNLRQLIRLVHHAEGVLCSVTALMHLAAAVETKPGRPANRPCVVVAGGREPAHWEAYPDHQFIHTNGALPCCSNGGCWKDRSERLRDGDERDHRDRLCVELVRNLPRCMDLIGADEVIRRIDLYFAARVLKPLTPRKQLAASRGIRRTTRNHYDLQPLNLHSAGMACDHFIRHLPNCPPGPQSNLRAAPSPVVGHDVRSASPPGFEGRGIVICGGGARYLPSAWVCISMLRRLGCALPVQLWFLGPRELSAGMTSLLTPLGVECIDACNLRKQVPARILNGWELKAYALLHSRFQETLLLDADNVPVSDPSYLFDDPEFRRTGAIFWPDYPHCRNRNSWPVWRSCGLRQPDEPEFESGQILVDKRRCWRALRLSLWFNEHSDFYYRYLHGDKETFHLAFRKLKQPYALVPTPIHALEATMCQHDLQGRRLFQHRNQDKWSLDTPNKRIRDFWFEAECRGFLAQLRRQQKPGLHKARSER